MYYKSLPYCKSRNLGYFPLCQNFRKFRSKRKWNGSAQVKIFRSKRRWSPLTGRSGPTENCRNIFRNFHFQSLSSSSLHRVVKTADGSDVFTSAVCVNLRCKTFNLFPYTQLHTRLRYSSAS